MTYLTKSEALWLSVAFCVVLLFSACSSKNQELAEEQYQTYLKEQSCDKPYAVRKLYEEKIGRGRYGDPYTYKEYYIESYHKCKDGYQFVVRTNL